MKRVLVAAFLLWIPTAASAQPVEDSNAARRFVRDIADDYKNFLSIDTAQWLGIGGIAAAAVHASDQWIYEQAQGPDAPTLSGGQQYGDLSVQVPLAIGWWVVGHAAHSSRDADAGRDLLRAQISALSWTYAFKYTANRTRPNGDPRSFPSGHASAVFATATVLEEHYGWKVGVPAFAAASYTAASRLTDNKHWASDVAFGAVLGMTCARTVTVRLRGSSVSLIPIALPGGGAVVAEVHR